MNENTFSFTFLCKFSCICNIGIFYRIFKKISPKCRTKQLGRYPPFWEVLLIFELGRGRYSAPNQAKEIHDEEETLYMVEAGFYSDMVLVSTYRSSNQLQPGFNSQLRQEEFSLSKRHAIKVWA